MHFIFVHYAKAQKPAGFEKNPGQNADDRFIPARYAGGIAFCDGLCYGAHR